MKASRTTERVLGTNERGQLEAMSEDCFYFPTDEQLPTGRTADMAEIERTGFYTRALLRVWEHEGTESFPMSEKTFETAQIRPAASGFGLYDLSEWCPEDTDPCTDEANTAEQFATDFGFTIAETPGPQYHGLIHNQSEADGWLIPDSAEVAPYPVAYRYVSVS